MRVFSLYVIELSDEAGPRKNPARPVVYVGQTSKTPEERFAQHKKGGKLASPRVFKHGIRLLPDLYRDRNPLSDSVDPVKAELKLAKYLEAHGYTVRGGGLRAERAKQRARRNRRPARPPPPAANAGPQSET
jgi:hypothetical protein